MQYSNAVVQHFMSRHKAHFVALIKILSKSHRTPFKKFTLRLSQNQLYGAEKVESAAAALIQTQDTLMLLDFR